MGLNGIATLWMRPKGYTTWCFSQAALVAGNHSRGWDSQGHALGVAVLY